MQITMRNFGPIREANFDLEKDFIVLFGKNNLGKSYAISIVYLVLKNLLKRETPDRILQTKFIKQLEEYFSTENTKNHGDEIGIIFYPLILPLVEAIEESFYITFDELDKTISPFSTEKPTITVTENTSLTLAIQQNKLIIQNIIPDIADINRFLQKQDSGEFQFHEPDLLENTFLFLDVLTQGKENRAIYYLPASRSGLYQALNAFSKILVELSKSRRFLTQKIELPSISEPVSDYFLGLSNIQPQKSQKANNAILNIVEEIEQTILKGEVTFDDQTKKIFYKPYQTDLTLDISFASSMVSELSPIVCYLKYVLAFAPSKSIIFIEEPEAHLHPDVQVQLMAIFAKLVKQNVKIIMTSHSDYLFNKMNNLIIAGEIDIASVQAMVFRETPTGSQAKELPIDKLGIDDDNFLEITETLFNEKLALVEQLNH